MHAAWRGNIRGCRVAGFRSAVSYVAWKCSVCGSVHLRQRAVDEAAAAAAAALVQAARLFWDQGKD